MLDLGISKLALIGVVALVVLGPERLPKVARIIGTLVGRAQRYVRDVKDEVSKDMDVQSLKKMAESSQAGFHDLETDIQSVWHDGKAAESSTFLPRKDGLLLPRHGRKHWRIQTTKMPLWYRQRHRVPSKLHTEAARMKKHRTYAAHVQRKSHSFFQ